MFYKHCEIYNNSDDLYISSSLTIFSEILCLEIYLTNFKKKVLIFKLKKFKFSFILDFKNTLYLNFNNRK